MSIRFSLTSLILSVVIVLFSAGCGGGGGEGEAEFLVIFCQSNNGEPYRAAQNKRFEDLFAEHENVEFKIYDVQNRPTSRSLRSSRRSSSSRTS